MTVIIIVMYANNDIIVIAAITAFAEIDNALKMLLCYTMLYIGTYFL